MKNLVNYLSNLQKVWHVGDEAENDSDSRSIILKKLDNYYRKVKRQILAFQSLTTGLFPNHLDPEKKTAHVVENVFCATAVWALRQCYRKIDNDEGRAHELGQAAVKCMRGILDCWMKQAKKVFKDLSF
jgi:phosphorylase kinase alpha/beta subunit